MSITFIISLFSISIVGLYIDKYGKRICILEKIPLIILISYLSLPYINPIFTYTLLGVSYALFGAIIYPSIPYIVSKE